MVRRSVSPDPVSLKLSPLSGVPTETYSLDTTGSVNESGPIAPGHSAYAGGRCRLDFA